MSHISALVATLNDALRDAARWRGTGNLDALRQNPRGGIARQADLELHGAMIRVEGRAAGRGDEADAAVEEAGSVLKDVDGFWEVTDDGWLQLVGRHMAACRRLRALEPVAEPPADP